MDNLNGLDFVRKTPISWSEIENLFTSTLNCKYIYFNEVLRMEDEIYVSFKIKDISNPDSIKDSFKKTSGSWIMTSVESLKI